MNKRFFLSAAWIIASSVMSPMLYAAEQACDTLVAVEYLSVQPDAATYFDQPRQRELNAALLAKLAEDTQLIFKVDPAQGQQALRDVQSGRVDLIVGVSDQPTKLDQLQYLEPAYAQKIYRLWRRSNEQLAPERWPELSGLRGVEAVPAEHLLEFKQHAQQLDWPLSSVESMGSGIDMLLAGEADYVLAEQQPLQKHVLNHELSGELESIEPAVATARLFVAIANDSVCNTAELRKALSAALQQFNKQKPVKNQ